MLRAMNGVSAVSGVIPVRSPLRWATGRAAIAPAATDDEQAIAGIEHRYHGQLFQTEYLSFLFAALLETASQDAAPTPGGGPHAQ